VEVGEGIVRALTRMMKGVKVTSDMWGRVDPRHIEPERPRYKKGGEGGVKDVKSCREHVNMGPPHIAGTLVGPAQ